MKQGLATNCELTALRSVGAGLRRCVTFDDPGLPQFWRSKAASRGSQYWRDRVVEYLTFPNPINTTLPHFGHLVRVDLAEHSRWMSANWAAL